MKNEEKLLTDNDDLVEFVSHQLYESICELHAQLAIAVGEKRANDIVVDALGINLGHILGQLSAKDQRKYANKTKQTIKEHTLLGSIAKDKHVYGNVGNA